MKRLYELYRYCMVHIVVKTNTGNYANGAGFHIGDGYLVTARHVVENQVIVSVRGLRKLNCPKDQGSRISIC